MKRLILTISLVLLVIMFSQCKKKNDDVQTISITQPTDTVDLGTTMNPMAKVQNNGDRDQTFQVRFTIGDWQDDTTVTIASKTETTVTFEQWIASDSGTFTTKCSTRLAGDKDPTNDAISGSVFVRSFMESDKAAIRRAVKSDTIWFNANTTTDSTHDTTYVKFGTDTLLLWWRGIQTHDVPSINIDVVGDSALVNWSRHNYGDLNLLIKVPDTSWQLWVKKVFETAQVRGVFRRTGETADTLRGWQLQKISLATGISDSVHTVKIDSLRIQSQSQPNLLIINPLNSFYRIDSLTSFHSAEPVTITLYTNAVDGNAFLHTFIFVFPWYIRVPFNHLGNGVYTGTWNTQIVEFPRFAIFDLMNHQTLFTPLGIYGYDFSGWLFPYQIKND